MWYVYIIRSLSASEQRYIGITDDLAKRLAKHNSGGSYHTAKFIPWETETVVGFNSKDKALAFESYLKSGSGFAFARKHF
jgi:putative endonuclease